MAIHAYVWCWAKPAAHLRKYHPLQWEVAKVKPSNSNMTLTVLNLHQKTPKGATTKNQVKRYKRDIKLIKIIILFSDDAINNTLIQ